MNGDADQKQCFVVYDKITVEDSEQAMICIAHLYTGHKSALFIRNICEYITAPETYGH